MEKNTVKLNTIGKVVAMLETIREVNRPMSIKELAETLGINKSSLHHHMKTLTELGYLQKDELSHKYDIGLGLVRVGQSYLQRLDVRERGHYFLEYLSRDLGETVHMLVLDKCEVVYVDKVAANHRPGSLVCSSFIGHRTDFYSTASGKILLSYLERGELEDLLSNVPLSNWTEFTISSIEQFRAELEEVKQKGYALDIQEHVLGMQCIAVPIFNHHSQCVAAVSVSCPTNTIERKVLEGEILLKLRETALQISTAMGYIPETRNSST